MKIIFISVACCVFPNAAVTLGAANLSRRGCARPVRQAVHICPHLLRSTGTTRVLHQRAGTNLVASHFKTAYHCPEKNTPKRAPRSNCTTWRYISQSATHTSATHACARTHATSKNASSPPNNISPSSPHEFNTGLRAVEGDVERQPCGKG